jgi:hypothetical protein
MARSKGVDGPQILPDLGAARDATAKLLAALSQIRLVGNPEPRRLAEEIVTLLVELMEQRIPGVPGAASGSARRSGCTRRSITGKASSSSRASSPGFRDSSPRARR